MKVTNQPIGEQFNPQRDSFEGATAVMAQSIIEHLWEAIDAAATLLRFAVAAGAAMPTRPAVEDKKIIERAPTRFDIETLVAQLAPMLVMSLAKGKDVLPDLGTVASQIEVERSEQLLLPLDQEVFGHFLRIQSVLAPDEVTQVVDFASKLSGPELRRWFDEISKLNVAQAVQKIRVAIAGNTEAVS
ncbi:MAG: hypothetical protein HOV81_21400 [Kofleriaceae bacterium]|nr:hypothetical protein [Kofleriaceae bacterium]